MVSSLLALSMLFIGIAVGSLSPLGIWGFIGFAAISTIFFVIDTIIEKDRSEL